MFSALEIADWFVVVCLCVYLFVLELALRVHVQNELQTLYRVSDDVCICRCKYKCCYSAASGSNDGSVC